MLVMLGCPHSGEAEVRDSVIVRDRDGGALSRACSCAAAHLIERHGGEWAGQRRRRFLRLPLRLADPGERINETWARMARHGIRAIDHSPIRLMAPPPKAPAFGSADRLVARDPLTPHVSDVVVGTVIDKFTGKPQPDLKPRPAKEMGDFGGATERLEGNLQAYRAMDQQARAEWVEKKLPARSAPSAFVDPRG